MYSIANRKMEVVCKILDNSTYMPASSVYQNLLRALKKMSISDLENLKLIIETQEQDAIGRYALSLGPLMLAKNGGAA